MIRNGDSILVANTDIVSGDVMLLDTGDKIIADGVVFEVHGLVIDEASLTGESDPIKKVVEDDCWCRSGTQVGTVAGTTPSLRSTTACLPACLHLVQCPALDASHCIRPCCTLPHPHPHPHPHRYSLSLTHPPTHPPTGVGGLW